MPHYVFKNIMEYGIGILGGIQLCKQKDNGMPLCISKDNGEHGGGEVKHKWILDEHGNIDKWQFEYGDIHNGPKCELCGFTFCMHCNPEYMDSDDCPGSHPLIAVPRTMVKKIPPSIGDKTNPCAEFVKEVCIGTELPKDDVLKVLLWLRDHGHIGIVGLMVESDYYPETACTLEEAEVEE